MATKQLVFELIGRDKSASSAIEGVGSSATRMGAIAGGAAGIVAGAFNLVTDAAMAAGRATADYVLEAIDNASGLNEAGTAIQSIFGEGGKADLSSWAQSTAKTIGQSQLQALKASQTFGIYGKAAGLADQALVDFAKSNVQMASDFASFYDSTPEEAIEAIGAAFRGEMEPIRKYGIMLDDASLKQKALEMGIYDGNDSLTAQQKTLAAQQLILEQGSVALGDFGKTSDGLANQQRILAATLEDTSTKIGTALLPIAQEVVSYFLNNVVPGFQTFADAVLPKLQELGESEAMGKLKQAIEDVDWERMGNEAADAAGDIVDLTGQVAELLKGYQEFDAWWIENDPLKKMSDSGIAAHEFIVGFVDSYLTGMGQINTVLADFGDNTRGMIADTGTNLLIGASNVAAFAQSVYNGYIGMGEHVAVFGDRVRLMGSLAAAVWQQGVADVGSWSLQIAGIVALTPGRMFSAVGNVAAQGAAIGANFIRGWADGILNGIGNLVQTVASAAARAVNAAKDALVIKSPSRVMRDEVGQQMTAGWALGIDDGYSDVERSIESVAALRPDMGGGYSGSGDSSAPHLRVTSQLGSQSLSEIIQLEIETASGWSRVDLENGMVV